MLTRHKVNEPRSRCYGVPGSETQNEKSHHFMPCKLDTATPFRGQSLAGITYTRLTVLSYAGKYISPRGSTYYFWNCMCICGNPVVARTGDLKAGKQRSCGCLKKEVTTQRNTTHGGCDHPMYGNWSGMIQRCRDANQKAYEYYGGKGIKVCKRWKDFSLFREDMEPTWKLGLTLERIEASRGYKPSNVRWATWDEQRRNRSDNHFITHNGVTKVITDWARSLGGNDGLIHTRLNLGWSEDQAVTLPLNASPKRR